MIFIRRSHTMMFVSAILGIVGFVADEQGLVGSLAERGRQLASADNGSQAGGIGVGVAPAAAPADEVVVVEGWDDIAGEDPIEPDMAFDPVDAEPDLLPEPVVDPLADAMDLSGPDQVGPDPAGPDPADDW